MHPGTETALAHLSLRIGVIADGWVDREPWASGDEQDALLVAKVMVPGGSILEIDHENSGVLYSNSMKRLGEVDLLDPARFASLMHNCDAMMAREYGPGALETFLLVDQLIWAAESEAIEAIMQRVPGPGDLIRRLQTNDDTLLADTRMKALAGSADPDTRKAYFDWKGIRTASATPAHWSDEASLARWSRRIARVVSVEPGIETQNGRWHRVEAPVGLVEAARSLGMVEGRLGTSSADRELYVLRYAGGYRTGIEPETVVAVAVFESGELSAVVKHVDVNRRPLERINCDLRNVIEHVERLQKIADDEIWAGNGVKL